MEDTSKIIHDEIPEFLRPQAKAVFTGPTLADLRQRSFSVGIDETKLLTAARYYHKVESLEHLSQSQIEDLLERIAEKYAVSSVEETKGVKRKLDKAA